MAVDTMRFAKIVQVAIPLALLAACTEAEQPQLQEAEPEEGAIRLVSVTHDEIKEQVAEGGATLTVVNFWATWCVPCIAEFPVFVEIGKEFATQGVDIVFVSADQPSQQERVVEFLNERGVEGVSLIQDEADLEFVSGFEPRWSGALPATFLFDQTGAMLTFWEGKTTYDELKRRLLEHLADAESSTEAT